jgi:DNA-binding MarR family transcriptional regulator
MSQFRKNLKTLISIGLTFQQLNKIFEARYKLSIVQWSLLHVLQGMPAVSLQTLAASLGVSPSTLSPAIARLNRKKYIFVCGDPKDARRKLVSITRDGKEKLDDTDVSFESAFAKLTALKNELEEVHDFLVISKRKHYDLVAKS